MNRFRPLIVVRLVTTAIHMLTGADVLSIGCLSGEIGEGERKVGEDNRPCEISSNDEQSSSFLR